MPLLLRVISKAKWYKENLPWLMENDLQADALTDLRTDNNKLSLYHIEDDKSNLERIITALASTRQRPDKLDYVLLELPILENAGFRIESTRGKTPDDAVNLWHRDMIELSATKVLSLAQIIANADKNRILEKQVGQLLVSAASSGRLKRTLVKEKAMKDFIDSRLRDAGISWPEQLD